MGPFKTDMESAGELNMNTLRYAIKKLDNEKKTKNKSSI